MSGVNILNILQSINDPNRNSAVDDKESASVNNSSSKLNEKKYASSTHVQEYNDVFNVLNEVNIPMIDLDLDFKPKGIEHSYSIRDAYKCRKNALSNSLLLKFMRDNIPDKEFFALDAAQYHESHNRRVNNNGRNSKNKKAQNKHRGNDYQSTNNPNSNRKGYANNHNNHLEDKPESSLEETFEMMKIEKGIESTGNKMQDFELFKKMMRGEHMNGDDEDADAQGPPGLSGMFATAGVDEDDFEELEPEGEDQSDSETFEEPTVKKSSKYASFFNENSEDDLKEEKEKVSNDHKSSSRSKMLDFLKVQEEKSKSRSPLPNDNNGLESMSNNQMFVNQPMSHHMPANQKQNLPQQGNTPSYQMGMPNGQQMPYPQGNQQHMNMNNHVQMPFNQQAQQVPPYMYGAPMGMQHQNVPQQLQMQSMQSMPQMQGHRQIPMDKMQQSNAQPHQMPNMQQNSVQQHQMSSMQQGNGQAHHMPNMQQMPPGLMPGMPYGNMQQNRDYRNGPPMPMPPFMDPNFRMLPPDQQMRIMQQFQQSMNKR